MDAHELTCRRVENFTFFVRFFSNPRFLRKDFFGRLEIQFTTLPAPAFLLPFGHQVSRKSGGKNRHRDISIAAPAGRLTLSHYDVFHL